MELVQLGRRLSQEQPSRPGTRLYAALVGEPLERGADRWAPRAGHRGEHLVGEPDVETDPLGGHRSPAVSEVPQHEQDPLVDPPKPADREVESQPVGALHQPAGDRRRYLGPRRHAAGELPDRHLARQHAVDQQQPQVARPVKVIGTNHPWSGGIAITCASARSRAIGSCSSLRSSPRSGSASRTATTSPESVLAPSRGSGVTANALPAHAPSHPPPTTHQATKPPSLQPRQTAPDQTTDTGRIWYFRSREFNPAA